MRDHAIEGRLIQKEGWLPRFNRVRERWRDPSLTMLLVVQCVTIFGIVPATAIGFPVPPAVTLILLLAFMSMVIVMARGRWTLAFGAGTLGLTAISALLQGQFPTIEARIAGEVIAIGTFSALSVVVFHAAFGPGRFTPHRIRGAVVLYLNIGLLFALLHRLVAELVPGAYHGLPQIESLAAFRAALDYYSFSTLTSLGLGDMAPVHPLARSLTTLEAAIGQLYPATLLARVVMLELAARSE